MAKSRGDGHGASTAGPHPLLKTRPTQVPFPSTGSDESHDTLPSNKQSPKASPDSQATSSSKQTSSDKLTALPTSTTTSPRIVRSPALSRGYRGSLDASTSLPSFATTGLDSQGGKAPGASVSDSSIGKNTPRQRVSFESERASKQSARQAFSRIHRTSDSAVPSPALRSSAYHEHRESQKDAESPRIGSRSPSHSRSRAASPLRLLQQWSAGLHRHPRAPVEDPFVPVDPFRAKLNIRLPWCSCFSNNETYDLERGSISVLGTPQYECDDFIPVSSIKSFCRHTHVFISDTLPRQVYLHFLLRLPAMYFTRVARIFEDAEVSKPDIQRMIDAGGGRGGGFIFPSAFEGSAPNANIAGGQGQGYPPVAPAMPLPFPEEWTPPMVSPALIRFKHSWEAFIDSLLREWKTLNVVSALLLSAILTMFQIPSAAADPLTRTAALLSLICALMSLSYGCMYIVRFGTMRSMYRACRWAEEARKDNTAIWWNVWVFLAMPAVWMAWSMVLFIISVLSFVWRTGSTLDPSERDPLSPHAALAARVSVTGLFVFGMVYFAMIVRTLQRYGVHPAERARRAAAAGLATSAAALGGSIAVNGNEAAGRGKDVETVLERRGRAMERGDSSRNRRKETVVDAAAQKEAAEVVTRKEVGLRLGLGLTVVTNGSNDSGIGLDLEKLQPDASTK